MQPFIGQISVVAVDFAPKGWALCNGQILPINQNQALFSLLGTTYGGNGINTFALPDLRGRAATAWGGNVVLGETDGVETVTLTLNQIPAHTHQAQCVNVDGDLAPPVGAIWAKSTGGDNQYKKTGTDVLMAPGALPGGGGNLPHEYMPPMLVLNFVIALQGIYPSRN